MLCSVNWLLGASVVLAVCSLITYQRGRPGLAVWWLVGAAFSLRLGLNSTNAFLHDWDERFHALVAKNMLLDPWQPVLRANPVLSYNYQLWTANHIWLHKQPLFLWQMASSLALFGVNEMALRLPSAVLGSLLLWPLYRLGRLIFNPAVGYHAAFLLAFAYYHLELTTGWQSVDHADVAFGVYMVSSIWAYYESRQPHVRTWWWGLLVGLFAAAAVLCKWLPGLVVYASWLVDILTHSQWRKQPREYVRLAASVGFSLLLILPWQVYIEQRFPLESSFERQYAALHFSQVLEQQGGPWHFYFTQDLWYQYQWLVLLLAAGLVLLATAAYRKQPLQPLLVSCALIFGFFSLAATKMRSYTYVMAPVLLLIAALAWVVGSQWLSQRPTKGRRLLIAASGLLVLLLDLRPTALLKNHFDGFSSQAVQLIRQRKQQHTAVYQQLDNWVPDGYVVFNAPIFEDVEAMFYSGRNVYSGWPTEAEYQMLRARGKRLAAFAGPSQLARPSYLSADEVLLVPTELK